MDAWRPGERLVQVLARTNDAGNREDLAGAGIDHHTGLAAAHCGFASLTEGTMRMGGPHHQARCGMRHTRFPRVSSWRWCCACCARCARGHGRRRMLCTLGRSPQRVWRHDAARRGSPAWATSPRSSPQDGPLSEPLASAAAECGERGGKVAPSTGQADRPCHGSLLVPSARQRAARERHNPHPASARHQAPHA